MMQQSYGQDESNSSAVMVACLADEGTTMVVLLLCSALARERARARVNERMRVSGGLCPRPFGLVTWAGAGVRPPRGAHGLCPVSHCRCESKSERPIQLGRTTTEA